MNKAKLSSKKWGKKMVPLTQLIKLRQKLRQQKLENAILRAKQFCEQDFAHLEPLARKDILGYIAILANAVKNSK